MKISRITLKDFRGFPGEYEFVLGEPGKNMLLYGENGAGKSSLFHALDLFLQASRDKLAISPYQNVFANPGEPAVKLDVVAFDANGDRVEGSQSYEWLAEASPYGLPLIEEAAKTRGCLDYKALLETHHVHLNSDQVDLFGLLINSLLAHTQNPISKKNLGDEWHTIIKATPTLTTKREKKALSKVNSDFHQGLEAILPDLQKLTNEFLVFFAHSVTISFEFYSCSLPFVKSKQLIPPIIHLKANYLGESVDRHHRFFNEARLSAIAISVYFASLLLNPASRLKVIVLDDVLIGLDMSNRLPVIKILEKKFSEWQKIILTHDRIWYDSVRFQTQEADWCYYELYADKDTEQGYDRPVLRSVKDGWSELLNRAKHHLLMNDERAAAVYSRAAFEYWTKSYCDKKKIPVPFTFDPTKPVINELWEAIKKRLEEKGRLAANQTKIADLETYRNIVLNPWSHGAGANVVKAEVEASIAAVEALNGMS